MPRHAPVAYVARSHVHAAACDAAKRCCMFPRRRAGAEQPFTSSPCPPSSIYQTQQQREQQQPCRSAPQGPILTPTPRCLPRTATDLCRGAHTRRRMHASNRHRLRSGRSTTRPRLVLGRLNACMQSLHGWHGAEGHNRDRKHTGHACCHAFVYDM